MNPYITILINVLAILLGTIAGCILKSRISDGLKANSNLYFAAVCFGLGARLAIKGEDFAVVVIAVLIGGVVGYAAKLDYRVHSLLSSIKNTDSESAMLLSGITLFCISISGILGAIELGIQQDPTLLLTKAVMDFTCALFLASSTGIMLAISALPLGVCLLLLFWLASFISPFLTENIVNNLSCCGGLILLLNGLRIGELREVPVIDLVPSLFLVVPLTYLWKWLI